MKIRELALGDLSALRARTYLCEFECDRGPTALVLEFAGKYGSGSEENCDADFMDAVKSTWLSILDVDAIVYDLRQMEYEWGNSIWNVFRGCCFGPKKVYPSALVVSNLCRPGFSTCGEIVPPMFDDLDEALRFVEGRARERCDDLMIGWPIGGSWIRWPNAAEES